MEHMGGHGGERRKDKHMMRWAAYSRLPCRHAGWAGQPSHASSVPVLYECGPNVVMLYVAVYWVWPCCC